MTRAHPFRMRKSFWGYGFYQVVHPFGMLKLPVLDTALGSPLLRDLDDKHVFPVFPRQVPFVPLWAPRYAVQDVIV